MFPPKFCSPASFSSLTTLSALSAKASLSVTATICSTALNRKIVSARRSIDPPLSPNQTCLHLFLMQPKSKHIWLQIEDLPTLHTRTQKHINTSPNTITITERQHIWNAKNAEQKPSCHSDVNTAAAISVLNIVCPKIINAHEWNRHVCLKRK